MRSLAQYFAGRQIDFLQPKKTHRRKPRRFFQIDAEICAHPHPGMFAISVSLFAGSRLIERGHLLLTIDECKNSQRAWLAGYNLAQRLAHKHAAERLYVREVAESRRRRAA